MILKEEPKRSLQPDHEGQAAQEQDLELVNCINQNLIKNQLICTYVSNCQQAFVEEQEHSKKEERHSEAGEADADFYLKNREIKKHDPDFTFFVFLFELEQKHSIIKGIK